MLIEVLTFLIAGVFAGTLSSMFGLGGGVVVVPVLYWIFKLHGMNPHEVMHMAVGSSLAVMIITTAGAIFGHYKKGNIHPKFFKNMFPLTALGAVIGSACSHYIHSDVLRYIFITFLVFVILQSFVGNGLSSNYKPSDCKMPNRFLVWFVGFFSGLIAVLLGVGGSVFSVPFLRRNKAPMQQAAGTAVALTPAVSILGAAGYIYAGIGSPELPPHSIGYVSISAFIFLSIGALMGVPVGLKVSEKLSDRLTSIAYIVVLCFILVSMVI